MPSFLNEQCINKTQWQIDGPFSTMAIMLTAKRLWFPRTGLRVHCNGLENAIITQINSPMRTKIVYDGDKGHTLKVNSQHFATFVKVSWVSLRIIHWSSFLITSLFKNVLNKTLTFGVTWPKYKKLLWTTLHSNQHPKDSPKKLSWMF